MSKLTDSETRAIRDHLFASPSHLNTGQAVFEAWPTIRAEVCKQFLEHLTQVIQKRAGGELSAIAPDLRVGCKYGGKKQYSNVLWMYRPNWARWERDSYSRGRPTIRMQSHQQGANGWYWGVHQPLPVDQMTAAGKDWRKRLDAELAKRLNLGRSSSWWPQYGLPEAVHANWDSLVSELYGECEAGGGATTNYYADNIIDIASRAIPVINEVELETAGSNPGSSG